MIQIIDLVPLLQKRGDIHRMIASFASLEGVEAMALSGVLDQKKRGVTTGKVAAVFLEWPDGRWWFQVGPTRPELPDSASESRIYAAVQGHSKPMGLGGWFRRARFEQLRIRLEPQSPGLVH